MKKVTKKETALVQELEKLNLHQNQFDAIIKWYRKTKDEVVCLDHGHRFKAINEGTKVRDFIFTADANTRKSRGVYKIKFDGNKFYIGRSKYIDTRIKQHTRELVKFFTDGEYAEEHYFKKVFEHLKEDQWAYYFSVTLLKKCDTVDELQINEQKWLDKYKEDPNCLNVGFIANKPLLEIDDTPEEYAERQKSVTVIRRNGRYIFLPNKKIESVAVDRRTESFVKSTPEKKAKANLPYLNVPELTSDLGPTVYKLYYGDRYVINKGKTLAGSLFLMQKGYGYYLAYEHHKESKFEKDYYFAFYEFIRKNPGKEFRVEIILTSQDPYEILLTEQIQLNENMRYKKCLNGNLDSYVPTFNPRTSMHGWITPEQVERFYTAKSAL